MKKQLLVMIYLLVTNRLPAGETISGLSAEEHARRINRMKEIAASSGGKIEIEVIRETEASSPRAPVLTLPGPERAAEPDLADHPASTSGAIVPDRIGENYVQALHLFHDRCPAKALELFESLLALFPKDDLVGDWCYWCGECNLALQDNEKAMTYWHQALTTVPCGKADQAMLRLIQVHHRLGDREETRRLLDRLLTDFPHSDAAVVAEMWAGKLAR